MYNLQATRYLVEFTPRFGFREFFQTRPIYLEVDHRSGKCLNSYVLRFSFAARSVGSDPTYFEALHYV